jgi:N-acetylglucosamine kinase-like BadF-type ATPase
MLVGVDVGGTNTRICVSRTGAERRPVSLATNSWRHGLLLSDPENAERLLAAIPHLPRTEPVSLVVGAHGCDDQGQCDLFAMWLRERQAGEVLVLNDAELLGPALGRHPAINVVCGTGSIVVGRSGTGQLLKVGGHGWMLGDPGSAPGLVREAVVAIMRAHDRGEPTGVMANRLMEHYSCPNPVDLGYDFTEDAGETRWGALAPLVFAAADAGDHLAVEVIDDGAQSLAQDIKTIIDLGAVGEDVVLGGGVISHQARLRRALTSHLFDAVPHVHVHLLKGPPVLGALALATALATGPSTTPSNQQTSRKWRRP